MYSRTRKTAALLTGAMMLAGVGLFPRPVLAEQPHPASKNDLTPGSFPALHALIRPQDQEWRHLRVHWITDPVAALKKAAGMKEKSASYSGPR